MSSSGFIADLRNQMQASGIHAYIIPFSDPHQNEYIPEHWQFRKWVSGFTGSAGTVVITMDFAGLWTDSRYFAQAERQLQSSGIELVKLKIPHTPEYIGWLGENLPKGSSVGLDNRFFSASFIRQLRHQLESIGISIDYQCDLISQRWTNRPALPGDPVFRHDDRYVGVTSKVKIDQVRTRMSESGCTHHLLSTLDDIAWLLNLRGNDIAFCPFFISHILIEPQQVLLFIDRAKIDNSLFEELSNNGVVVKPYEMVQEALGELAPGTSIMLAPEKINHHLFSAIPEGCFITEAMNPSTALKAIKSEVELAGLREVMIKDGAAWINLLKWLDDQMNTGNYPDELSVAEKIAWFRSQQEGYLGESFHPISSYEYHGSVVHYSVTKEESIRLRPEGIFLLDSGGHFLQGTTDTTRTIALSEPTPQQKTDFTLALKGTLGVSMLRFPKGTKGYQIDILARKALWDHAMNYGHGTGHGVGFLLSVHEGPQTIGTSASGYQQVSLDPGMVTTVEPAIYREGSYGMRTENMTVVVEDLTNEYGTFYRFETITAVPIDVNLVDLNLLTPEERAWLSRYHAWVIEAMQGRLDEETMRWLVKKAKTNFDATDAN